MITRLILKLPWPVSTPLILAGAIVLAVGWNYVAGDYFERIRRNDIDPFAFAGAGTGTSAGPAAAVTTGPSAAATPAPAAAASPGAGATTGAGTTGGGATLLAQGQFKDGDPAHHGKGKATLGRTADGKLVLRFEDFSVTNGPDLYVVLSTDPNASRGSAGAADALNLGRLKATDGNVNYDVPAGTDLSKYKSVIIWCRMFNVVFATAKLEPPR
jgi:hypothetical protein